MRVKTFERIRYCMCCITLYTERYNNILKSSKFNKELFVNELSMHHGLLAHRQRVKEKYKYPDKIKIIIETINLHVKYIRTSSKFFSIF